jgi:hypothetical protein
VIRYTKTREGVKANERGHNTVLGIVCSLTLCNAMNG